MSQPPRIYLSPPHLSGDEEAFVLGAIRSNWIAPLGPEVDAFEREFAAWLGAGRAVALSSGTAALHLALLALGVERGDEIAVSSLTFAGSVNPIVYTGGTPVLIDSERASWNLDPDLLEEWLHGRAALGRLPRAVIPVHLYGQCADMARILDICARWDVPVIEDAAEALGATWHGKPAGTIAPTSIFSFNGNKVITTSGGGMLVTTDPAVEARARKLAAQAREPAPHYEHAEIGYNYRLSNLLAALGRAQLGSLDARVLARRAVFAGYRERLGDLPGVEFMPEAPWGSHARWLTVLTIDPGTGVTPDDLRLALERENIEARPVWKPMHRQPVFAAAPRLGGAVADELFERGLCLPSGSSLTPRELDRIAGVMRQVFAARGALAGGRA